MIDYVREYTGHLFFDIPSFVKIDSRHAKHRSRDTASRNSADRTGKAVVVRGPNGVRGYDSITQASKAEGFSVGAIINRCEKCQVVNGESWSYE